MHRSRTTDAAGSSTLWKAPPDPTIAVEAAEDPPTDQPPTAELITDRPARELIDRLATSAPVPGGGSASAFAGAMAAALVGMVVELTRGRPGAEDAAHELEAIGTAAGSLRGELLRLTDLDAEAYRAVVAARRLPRDSEEERAARSERITEATREATRAPMRIAQAAAATLTLAERIAPIGNPNALSDVGVAALLAVAAVSSAALNVRINLPYLPDDDRLRADADRALDDVTSDLEARASAIHRLVEDRIG